ncbi:Hypothetical predicted protein [Paramuricea clavata]|uniref:Uncharacterized protein n=1 Tax=Paramuricea clavata TaxID=317549 RepID=A0A6S7HZ81_PARCT|nr:Hypothetical predicted protein [Paramuricea clavata]
MTEGQERTGQDAIYEQNMQIEDIQSDETANKEELQADTESAVPEVQISEEIKELRICRLFVTWPKLFFGLTLGGHCLAIFTSTILYIAGYDILPIDFSAVPLNLEDDPTKLRADAWKFASESDAVTLSSSAVSGSAQRIVRYQGLELVYESQEKNMLTKTTLKRIQTLENELQNNKIWNEKLCMLGPTQTCRKPTSILRFFDGTYQSLHEDLFDPNFDNILHVLVTAQSLNTTRSTLAYHLGKDAAIDNLTQTAQSKYTRSLMNIAWPLDGFNSTLNQKEEQTEKSDSLTIDAFADKLKRTYTKGLPGIKFYYYNRAIYVNEIQLQFPLTAARRIDLRNLLGFARRRKLFLGRAISTMRRPHPRTLHKNK